MNQGKSEIFNFLEYATKSFSRERGLDRDLTTGDFAESAVKIIYRALVLSYVSIRQ